MLANFLGATLLTIRVPLWYIELNSGLTLISDDFVGIRALIVCWDRNRRKGTLDVFEGVGVSPANRSVWG